MVSVDFEGETFVQFLRDGERMRAQHATCRAAAEEPTRLRRDNELLRLEMAKRGEQQQSLAALVKELQSALQR